MASESMVDGSALAGRALAVVVVSHMFGVVGIPVTAVATRAVAAGVRFIAFHNEQSAGYAASAYGYLTSKAGVLLTVSGPSACTAWTGCRMPVVNTWPVVMIFASCDQADFGKGNFQRPYIPPFPTGKTSSDTQYAQYFEKARTQRRPGNPPEPVAGGSNRVWPARNTPSRNKKPPVEQDPYNNLLPPFPTDGTNANYTEVFARYKDNMSPAVPPIVPHTPRRDEGPKLKLALDASPKPKLQRCSCFGL